MEHAASVFPDDWSDFLRELTDPALVDAVRQYKRKGYPCSDNGFERKMEKVLGGVLTALPKGRPLKTD